MLTLTEDIPLTRPSFKLDTSRLRSFREESFLTQRKVAQQANTILEKFNQIANKNKFKSDEDLLDSYERSYQRIEQTGNTSKKMATALAQVFKTTVKILQGGAPEAEGYSSVVAQVEQQLREQKKLGSNLALQRALTQYDCMHEFAEDISVAIEMAQIGQNSSEIARLTELTGWSEAQLQQLGSVNGHWLLITTLRGSPENKIVLGIEAVLSEIQETFKEWITGQCSDVRITMHRSIPWYHVDIDDPLIPKWDLKFSFVRFKPEASGLKFVKPTWLDQFCLEEDLKKWAFSKANFLTDFEGNKTPNDVRRLMFRVRERDVSGVYQRIAYSKGYLEELPEERFQIFKADGHSHSCVINYLNSDCLLQSLAPYLTICPLEYWSIRADDRHIAISLCIPYRWLLANKNHVCCNGIQYIIDLVEETSPSIYHTVPWRDSSVANVCSLLEKRMLEKFDDIEHQDLLQFLSLPVSSS